MRHKNTPGAPNFFELLQGGERPPSSKVWRALAGLVGSFSEELSE